MLVDSKYASFTCNTCYETENTETEQLHGTCYKQEDGSNPMEHGHFSFAKDFQTNLKHLRAVTAGNGMQEGGR